MHFNSNFKERFNKIAKKVNSLDSEYYEFSSFIERIRTTFGLLIALTVLSNLIIISFVLIWFFTDGFGQLRLLFFTLFIPFFISLLVAIFLIFLNNSFRNFFQINEKNWLFLWTCVFSSLPIFNLWLIVRLNKTIKNFASDYGFKIVNKYNSLTSGIFVFDFADYVSFEANLTNWKNTNDKNRNFVNFFETISKEKTGVVQKPVLNFQRLYVNRLYYQSKLSVGSNQQTPQTAFDNLRNYIENKQRETVRVKQYILT
ncbi:MPN359 family protein [Mycoplasmoides genitalium]